MTVSYQNLIQTNPVVPYAMQGFQKAAWCNLIVLSLSSVKQYQISVYANTAAEAVFYANNLKAHIEANPMVNDFGVIDDIAIGLRPARLDNESKAYFVEMVMNTGMLQIIDTKKIINPCGASIGGLEGYDFLMDGLWSKKCIMFKG